MLAVELMRRFADRTGVSGAPEASPEPAGEADASPGRAAAASRRRYLWTDAFAVCNFLGLARATGEARYLELAVQLVDDVHHELGRHRADDARRGWLSGLSEADGEAHPTLGGLRIGKPLPERPAGEPLDDRLEWDRDGQYFHYLTRWMHALDQLARMTGRDTFARHACELADAAHRTFVHGGPGRRRMYWKMSIDLTRPLVAAMGHHDALDGYVTLRALEATRCHLGARGPELGEAIAELGAMIEPELLATADPLGIGGLLVDACWLAQLPGDTALRDAVVTAAERGLERYARAPDLFLGADHRLAFRELGLAIGLGAIARQGVAPRLERHVGIGAAIESFWAVAEHRRAASWRDHADINEVMLATSLAPEGFLGIPAGAPGDWQRSGAGSPRAQIRADR